jgi:hypothetical protein
MLEQLLPGPLREVAQDQPPDGSASLWKSQRPDPSTIVSAATRNCPETATKLPAGGHETAR